MRKFLAFLMALVMVMILAACDRPTEPVATEPDNTVTVRTVNELLAALGPDRTILLEPGQYDLSTASDYGKISENPYYTWRIGYEEYELNLHNLRNLTVVGSGMGQTSLQTVPNSETILKLINCENVTFRGLSVGFAKTTDQWHYNRAFEMEGCNGIKLEETELFGSGAEGIYVRNCRDLTISDSHIYNCYSAASLNGCRDISIRGCKIYHIGSKTEAAYCILSATDSSDVTMDNCSISGCITAILVDKYGTSDNFRFKNTLFQGNTVLDTALVSYEGTITVDNCSFTDNDVECWLLVEHSGQVVDAAGNMMTDADFHTLNGTEAQNYTVSTIDEFLATLGSNRVIQLAPGTYSLCDASNYGQWTDSRHYQWVDMYDGYQLELTDIRNLTIIGSGADQTVIETLPRSAAVLSLNSCSNIAIQSLTMGHVEMAEYCEGAVLSMQFCGNVNLEGLGLYGCGTEGVQGYHCSALVVNNCHIYDCSMFGIFLDNCDSVSIVNSTFDHLGKAGQGAMSILSVNQSYDVTMDNCTASDSVVYNLVNWFDCYGTTTVRNTTFRNNLVEDAAFTRHGGGTVILDNCTFGGNAVAFWYGAGETTFVLDADGVPIHAADFEAMYG